MVNREGYMRSGRLARAISRFRAEKRVNKDGVMPLRL